MNQDLYCTRRILRARTGSIVRRRPVLRISHRVREGPNLLYNVGFALFNFRAAELPTGLSLVKRLPLRTFRVRDDLRDKRESQFIETSL